MLDPVRAAAPHAHALWREKLAVNARVFEGFPTHSCSVGGHVVAAKFASFLRPFLRGRVLDLGCGPHPVPRYLDGAACEVVGLDPLLPTGGPHPFPFVQAVAEGLPFAPARFDTVVAATSLDHVCLLSQTLGEAARVLKSGGRFVAWVGLVPGARPYDPLAPDLVPADDFHVFHLDRPWFERLCGQWFRLVRVEHLQQPYRASFYVWRTPIAAAPGGVN